MGSFHFWDLLPLVLLALFIFGPKRLPEMGSAIGKTIKEFQKGMKEVSEPQATTPAVPAAPQTPVITPADASAQTPALPAATSTVASTAETKAE